MYSPWKCFIVHDPHPVNKAIQETEMRALARINDNKECQLHIPTTRRYHLRISQPCSKYSNGSLHNKEWGGSILVARLWSQDFSRSGMIQDSNASSASAACVVCFCFVFANAKYKDNTLDYRERLPVSPAASQLKDTWWKRGSMGALLDYKW